ncbi:hypothetical protein SacmaDRAFT_5668 [Saccharomonospora marina XMU15]|uniref:Mycothiol-dependent maleylpyruvate isomerase metal-binding domain-containing protein n=1 Tax=Saccharomonospora marina XMU15 TaxID=882083 RepID=H5XB52_9PSEU|nr:maleylpyruvate isomerase family mycothiol-dependent enzyme [Saccharomonospora marina]EHR53782.1 hypothetical protein SacmaDRAFT_5668 [Saccharomonospora marina XMU15]
MAEFSWLGEPIDAGSAFGPEREALLTDLRGLTPQQWELAALPGWTVKDLAAHVLGGDYGRLARTRDGYDAGMGPRDGEPFATFIHRLNQEWVDACARLSPRSLLESLEFTGERIERLWSAVDPDEYGTPVSWAGADPAPMWLDRARDFTEYWVHRQQIREAVGESVAAEQDSLRLVLDTFARALPFTLRGVRRAEGTQLRLTVDGTAAGSWTATSTGEGWSLDASLPGSATAEIQLDSGTAWRLCTRTIEPAVAISRGRLDGDRELAEAACEIVSIIR